MIKRGWVKLYYEDGSCLNGSYNQRRVDVNARDPKLYETYARYLLKRRFKTKNRPSDDEKQTIGYRLLYGSTTSDAIKSKLVIIYKPNEQTKKTGASS